MCFVKSKPVEVTPQVQETVERKEADATLSKTNQLDRTNSSGFKQNVKTSAFGLEDNAKTEKKTFLGE